MIMQLQSKSCVYVTMHPFQFIVRVRTFPCVQQKLVFTVQTLQKTVDIRQFSVNRQGG